MSTYTSAHPSSDPWLDIAMQVKNNACDSLPLLVAIAHQT